MKLMIEVCTKKARTGLKRRTWWDEPEGEDELLNDIEDSEIRKTFGNKETKCKG